MSELVLVKHAEFDGVELDCYIEPTQQDKGAFWATREQIGRLLDYENPNDAIKIIHLRHSERLDKFSTRINLNRVEGGREVERDVTVYNFKGLLEICRYSNQPKADAVMDLLWDVADEIRRTGSYTLKRKRKTAKKKPALPLQEVMNAAEKIYHLALRCSDDDDVREVIALDEAFKHFTGESALEIAHFKVRCGNEMLRLDFAHPALQEDERLTELWNSAEYLNLMEEFEYAWALAR